MNCDAPNPSESASAIEPQVDTLGESTLIALRLIDRLTAKVWLLPDDRKHLELLWKIIDLQAHPVMIVSQDTGTDLPKRSPKAKKKAS